MSTDTGHTLGIDVGTTATKVILLKPTGEWEMESWPSEERVWENLRTWLHGLGEIVGSEGFGREISRVGITGHGPPLRLFVMANWLGASFPGTSHCPRTAYARLRATMSLLPIGPGYLLVWRSGNPRTGQLATVWRCN